MRDKAQDGKVVVMTGVTRGLGRAMAEEFMALGHRVLGCGTAPDRLGELREAAGQTHDFALVDVTVEEAVAAWAKRLLARHGPPDLLVNNAGIINRNSVLWEVPGEEFDRLVKVNILGVARVIRHFVPAMAKRRRGVIVNFSSGWGRSVSPEVAPYCATKWAMEGLTKALAQELPSGMAAVPLNPGVIDTDMLRSCFGRGAEGHAKPRQWARTAVPFLLGLGARHNGQSLTAP